MDIQKYIESGVLEEYCLGALNDEDQAFLIQMTMLYPEIKAALTAVELTMEKLANAAAIEPAESLKGKIFAKLGFDNSAVFDINNLPALDKNANRQAWINAVEHLIPVAPTQDFLCEVIRKDNYFQQMLVVTRIDVPEEDHEDYLESFFILEGHCECTVGDKRFKLGAGDFLEIPLHVKHNVHVTSPYVVAILQYQFL